MAFYRGEGGSGTGDVTAIPFSVAEGGTGASSVPGARASLGVTATGQDTTYAYRSNNLSDLSSAATARTNLGLGTAATTASTDYATAAQGSLADSAVQPGDLATVATSGSYNDLTDLPSLFSGDYDDLSNKPSIPSSIDDLSDVTITSASNGQVLSYNGTAWVNGSAGTGTVTSVSATVPTGLSVSGSPITSSGTLAITYAAGYAIPTTAKQTEWDTAYGWGNHASAGYLTSYSETDPVVGAITGIVKADGAGNITAAVAGTDYLASFTESDPVFSASEAASITSADTTNWDAAYGWGNHASAGYLTTVALNDVSDVTITTPSSGQVLKYNGTAWVNDTDSAPVTSVNGQTGVVSLSTTNISEGTNLYYTDARARASVSASGSLSYNSSTGVFSYTEAVSSVAGKTGAVTLTSSDVGLGNVENTALSTWAGSANITTLGTVTTGTIAGGTY